MPPVAYPARGPDRDRWILRYREPRPALDPRQPYAFLLEEEANAPGQLDQIATVFLTNRECPWRCVMCDLWKNTLAHTVPPGAIPAQIDYALEQLRLRHAAHFAPRQIKLYNSGSFFDPRAVPPEDNPAIAERVRSFQRLIVECHPALVTERLLPFHDRLRRGGGPRLEIALGLETAHPGVLAKLNKRMTLARFAQAAAFLRRHDIDLRAFVLVQPPFLPPSRAVHWAERSVQFAFDQGARAVSLIPTRGGNGALEQLAAQGHFQPPTLATLESALARGLQLARGLVWADLWDLEPFCDCPVCRAPRIERLRVMNRKQQILPSVSCPSCGHGQGTPPESGRAWGP